jgi:hypothetical protein
VNQDEFTALVAQHGPKRTGFLTPLRSEDLPGGREYKLLDLLVYYDKQTDAYFTVPPGFVCNSYSATPGPVGSWMVHKIDRRPAFLHDYLYATGTVSRKEADRMFDEAMKSCGINWFRRRVMFQVVRAFGPLHFYDEEERKGQI